MHSPGAQRSGSTPKADITQVDDRQLHATLPSSAVVSPEKMPASSLPFLGQVPQNVWRTT